MVDFRINLDYKEFYVCKKFSIESAKTQREYRSGGSQFRTLKVIQNDTLIGKVGEFVVKKFLEQPPFNIKGIKLDFKLYARGKWDDADFFIGKMKFSVKSAKWFSRWLLLESKDINRRDLYDIYILVTIEKNYKTGTIRGFAYKNEVLNREKALKLKKGDFIPGTHTSLDADNHAIHSKDLHNSIKDWKELLSNIKTNDICVY